MKADWKVIYRFEQTTTHVLTGCLSWRLLFKPFGLVHPRQSSNWDKSAICLAWATLNRLQRGLRLKSDGQGLRLVCIQTGQTSR